MYSLRTRNIVPMELPAATSSRVRGRKRSHVSVEYEKEPLPDTYPETSAHYLGRPVKVEQPDSPPVRVQEPVILKQQDTAQTPVKLERPGILSQCQWSGHDGAGMPVPLRLNTGPHDFSNQSLSHFNYPSFPRQVVSPPPVTPAHYPWRPIKLEQPDPDVDPQLHRIPVEPVLPQCIAEPPVKLEHPGVLSQCQWPGQVMGMGLGPQVSMGPQRFLNQPYLPNFHHPSFPSPAASLPQFQFHTSPYQPYTIASGHGAVPPPSYAQSIKEEPQDDIIVWQPELGLASFQPGDSVPEIMVPGLEEGWNGDAEGGGISLDGTSPRTPKRKRSRASIKKEEEAEEEGWEPPLWQAHLDNIKKMREVRNAPVDTAGAMSTPDPAAVNEVRV